MGARVDSLGIFDIDGGVGEGGEGGEEKKRVGLGRGEPSL